MSVNVELSMVGNWVADADFPDGGYYEHHIIGKDGKVQECYMEWEKRMDRKFHSFGGFYTAVYREAEAEAEWELRNSQNAGFNVAQSIWRSLLEILPGLSKYSDELGISVEHYQLHDFRKELEIMAASLDERESSVSESLAEGPITVINCGRTTEQLKEYLRSFYRLTNLYLKARKLYPGREFIISGC